MKHALKCYTFTFLFDLSIKLALRFIPQNPLEVEWREPFEIQTLECGIHQPRLSKGAKIFLLTDLRGANAVHSSFSGFPCLGECIPKLANSS